MRNRGSHGSVRRMEWVVLERDFDPPLSQEAMFEKMSEDNSCWDLYGVTPVRSYLAHGGRRMICIFRAPDAEAIRSLVRGDSTPATVWTSTIHTL